MPVLSIVRSLRPLDYVRSRDDNDGVHKGSGNVGEGLWLMCGRPAWTPCASPGKCRSSSKDTVHRYLLAICTTQCNINCSTRPQHGASSPFPFYPSHNLRARHFQVPKSCAPVWGLKAFFRRLAVWRETILGQLVYTVVKKSHRCSEMWRGNKRRYNGKLGFIFQPRATATDRFSATLGPEQGNQSSDSEGKSLKRSGGCLWR